MFQECCDIASAALDGAYGWKQELVSILVVVIIFNFLAKWILRRLHKRFQEQRKFWEDSFVQALYTPLSCYTWFFALAHAINLIIPHLTDSTDYFAHLHTALKVAAILSITWFILRWKNLMIKLTLIKSRRHEISMDVGKIDVIDKVITVFVIFVACLLLMEATGRSITTLIAFGGIGGLAIAFASQEMIANFFSGLMVYITHPFQVGDWINLPERNLEGHVEEIGWYMTRIRTFEKRPIYIPNSIFSKIVVETPSRMSHRQFKETIGLRYSDMNAIKPVIQGITNMLQSHPHIDNDQKMSVSLKAFGTYSLDIEILAYTTTVDSEEYAQVKQDLLLKIIDVLNENKAEMASPLTLIDIPNGIQLRQ